MIDMNDERKSERFADRLARKGIKPDGGMYIVAALPFVLIGYIVLTLYIVAG